MTEELVAKDLEIQAMNGISPTEITTLKKLIEQLTNENKTLLAELDALKF